MKQTNNNNNNSIEAKGVVNKTTVKDYILNIARCKMNTPPPPLQPITMEAMNGLNHYFGQPANQPQLHLFNSSNSLLRNISSTITSSSSSNATNSILTSSNIVQQSPNSIIQTSLNQINYNNKNSNQAFFFPSNIQLINRTNSDFMSSEDNSSDNMNQTSIQEKKTIIKSLLAN